jgi:hypothetical protein
VSSTNSVDFSVRQNKSIERLIVFENLRNIISALSLRKMVYVGLGSVWFSDFLLAHRDLRVESMVSIEEDPITYRRASFNKPFRTLSVREGKSVDVLPDLLRNETLNNRPWIVWLDYDAVIDETSLEEIASLLNSLPADSFLVVTCNAQPNLYRQLHERVSYLESLFGDAIQENLTNGMVKDDTSFMNILRKALDNFMLSTALQIARPGGYESAFNIAYRDGAPMVTVGGFLPSPANATAAAKLIRSKNWSGRVEKAIITPPLTSKEVAVLQAQLPRVRKLTRRQIQRLGFDLDEAQIESFQNHYLKYPTFVQIVR